MELQVFKIISHEKGFGEETMELSPLLDSLLMSEPNRESDLFLWSIGWGLAGAGCCASSRPMSSVVATVVE